MKKFLFLFILVLLTGSVLAEVSTDLEDEMNGMGPDEYISVLIQVDELEQNHLDILNSFGEVENTYDAFDGVYMDVPVSEVGSLEERGFVDRIEPDYTVETMLSSTVSQIEADMVWDYNNTGGEVDVAVLDTGVESGHSALELAGEKDFTGEGPNDMRGHGTHVAGVVGSLDGSRTGVSPSSNLYNVKVLDSEGSGTGSDLLKGLEWSIENEMDVAVMSLGTVINKCNGRDILSTSVDKAVDEGVTVVVAAGNEGPERRTVTSPGCSRNGITVGSVNKRDGIASYSSRGSTNDGRVKPDVVAPGSNIESTWIDNSFNSLSGTSMATPHVGGQAALLLNEDPDLTPEEVKNVVMDTSTDLGLNSNVQGSGRINVSKSYFYISENERENITDVTKTSSSSENSSLIQRLFKRIKTVLML